jgi:phototropin
VSRILACARYEETLLTGHLFISIADNPIVYASDGFVSVTGYSRSDIIPRNCRFLQGNHTDHAAVRRLKACIGANKESVELLLNYRKTGEPFWNLLYVSKFVRTPLIIVS